MGNTTKVIVALVVVAVIAIGGVLLFDSRAGDDGSSGTTNESSTQPSTDDSSQPAEEEAVTIITYTDGGFSPASITVPSGSTVRIVNEATEIVGPSSDPHPDHSINTELNFPDIDPGQSATRVLTQIGTWGYHNHLKEDHAGTIVVE